MQLHPATRSIVFPAHLLPARYEFPTQHIAEHNLVATPCKRDICAALNLSGLWPYGPINLDYKWPAQFKPMVHQKITADFFTWHKRAFCFNEIGTGKTMSALWALDYLLQCGEVINALVITTLSTMQSAWGIELDKHLPHLSYMILHGSAARRASRVHTDAKIKIINHDGIKVIAEELYALVKRGVIGVIIVDEGAEFTNGQTDKYKALRWICNASPTVRVWWMTGSPMPHAPTDIWAQGRIICPDRLPLHYSHWQNKVMQRAGPFKWEPVKNWEAIVAAAIAPVVRFKRAECIDLPPTTYSTVQVEMTRSQQTAYNEMRVRLRTEIGTTAITAVNEAVKLGKLVQITCGAVYDAESKVAALDCAPKLKELVRLIREAGGVAIVFTSFSSALDTVGDTLQRAKIRYARVDGSVSRGARDRIFAGFKAGFIDVILAHPKTMAHGLTLVRANTIIWFGPPQSYRVYEQANGRVTRPGQKQKTTIVHLTCSKIELGVYDRLQRQEELQGLLLDILQTPA